MSAASRGRFRARPPEDPCERSGESQRDEVCSGPDGSLTGRDARLGRVAEGDTGE